MEFSGELLLIGSSNARLTCLAVELLPKASFPLLKSDTCPLPLLSNRTLPCIRHRRQPSEWRSACQPRRSQSVVQLGTTL